MFCFCSDGPITGALIDLYANDPTSRRQLIRNSASGNFKTLVAASAVRRKPKPNRKSSRIASDRAEVVVLERGHVWFPFWPPPPWDSRLENRESGRRDSGPQLQTRGSWHSARLLRSEFVAKLSGLGHFFRLLAWPTSCTHVRVGCSFRWPVSWGW